MNTSDQRLLQQLKTGEQEVLKAIYLQYRKDFIGWLTAQNCPTEEAVEIFQLTILTLYDNVINGKLKILNSSLRTYIFSIGKNKWKELQRAAVKRNRIFDEFFYDHITDADLEDREHYERLLDLIAESLKNLGQPCQSLLELYYYQGMSMKEISEKMGYKNPNTAKNQKYKCLNRLRKIIQAELEKTLDNEVKPRGITPDRNLPSRKFE